MFSTFTVFQIASIPGPGSGVSGESDTFPSRQAPESTIRNLKKKLAGTTKGASIKKLGGRIWRVERSAQDHFLPLAFSFVKESVHFTLEINSEAI